jgi:hypothetical protein
VSAAKLRICCICSNQEMTASKSPHCAKCFNDAKGTAKRLEEKKYLEVLYTNVSGPEYNHHGKPVWTFTHECGVEQSWVFGNILKQRKMNPNSVPCSRCGGKSRMKKAMAGYMEKYGYKDLLEYRRYCRKVRGLSDLNYNLYKSEINPHNLERGMHTYHLDHKMAIIEGFLLGLDAEFMARKENLQMLSAPDNLSKGRRRS